MNASADFVSEINFLGAQRDPHSGLMTSIESEPITAASPGADHRSIEQNDYVVTRSVEVAQSCALDCLLNKILSFYVSAEKVHWHLRLSSEADLVGDSLSERLAKDFCVYALEIISLIVRAKYISDGNSNPECAQLMTTIAARRSELHGVNAMESTIAHTIEMRGPLSTALTGHA